MSASALLQPSPDLLHIVKRSQHNSNIAHLLPHACNDFVQITTYPFWRHPGSRPQTEGLPEMPLHVGDLLIQVAQLFREDVVVVRQPLLADAVDGTLVDLFQFQLQFKQS